MAEQLFLFIQLEFPWALGPPDGRYLLRAPPDAEPEHVVVLGTLGAQRSLGRAAPLLEPARRPAVSRPRRARDPPRPSPPPWPQRG